MTWSLTTLSRLSSNAFIAALGLPLAAAAAMSAARPAAVTGRRGVGGQANRALLGLCARAGLSKWLPFQSCPYNRRPAAQASRHRPGQACCSPAVSICSRHASRRPTHTLHRFISITCMRGCRGGWGRAFSLGTVRRPMPLLWPPTPINRAVRPQPTCEMTPGRSKGPWGACLGRRGCGAHARLGRGVQERLGHLKVNKSKLVDHPTGRQPLWDHGRAGHSGAAGTFAHLQCSRSSECLALHQWQHPHHPCLGAPVP